MNIPNDIGLGEIQQVIVALNRLPPLSKFVTAVVLFRQLVALDHRAHRPVQEQYLFAGKCFECVLHFLTFTATGKGNELGSSPYLPPSFGVGCGTFIDGSIGCQDVFGPVPSVFLDKLCKYKTTCLSFD